MNNYDILICCYGVKVELIEKPIYHIQLYHKHDSQKLCLSVSPNQQLNETESKIREYVSEIDKWYYQLQIILQKSDSLDFQSLRFRPVGKIQIEIVEGYNLQSLPKNSQLIVRISVAPHILYTKKQIACVNPKWRQKFLIPVPDFFFSIQIDLVAVVNEGWISEHVKDQIYGSYEILIADLISHFAESRKIKLTLPLELTTQKKNQIAKIYNSQTIPEDKRPQISISLIDRSNFKGFFTSPPTNYIEGFKMHRDILNKTELKFNFERVRRISANVNKLILQLDCFIQFKYPLFSTIIMLILGLFIIFVDLNSIHRYLLFVVCLFLGYNYPKVNKVVSPIINHYFFSPSRLNKHYRKPKIYTIPQWEAQKLSDIQRFTEKVKSTAGYYTQYKELKKSLARLTFSLAWINNILEKSKNLLFWNDIQRTFWLACFAFVLYCITYQLPIRYFIAIALFNEWRTGRTYYLRCHNHNVKIITVIIEFTIKKHYPEFLTFFQNPNEKIKQLSNYKEFQKKLHYYMVELARLKIDDPNLFSRYDTVNSLINYLSAADVKIKYDKNHEANNCMMLRELIKKNKIKNLTKGKKMLFQVINYIQNIPSDYYRLKNPNKLNELLN